MGGHRRHLRPVPETRRQEAAPAGQSRPQAGAEPGGETVLLFTHADWREPVEFMHHCSTKWAYFLLGLKAGLEGGPATPYPQDMAISSWG